MAEAIYKYAIRIKDEVTLEVPKGSRFLCVQNQNETLCIWMVVNVYETKKESRTFYIYGTGHNHESITGKYRGSTQMQSGRLVWHIFEDYKIENS